MRISNGDQKSEKRVKKLYRRKVSAIFSRTANRRPNDRLFFFLVKYLINMKFAGFNWQTLSSLLNFNVKDLLQ